MTKVRILWADDEIDLLKPHILFLQQKGYDVSTSNNGDEAVDMVRENQYDIVFLDENMPGLTGLETLTIIKEISPNLPVVMITKSEEESIMEDAIGSNISDYLIKPVNPNQILLCLKKNLDTQNLVSQKTTMGYQQEFRNIGMDIGGNLDFEEWKDIYKKLISWELKLEKSKDEGMNDVFKMQKEEANQAFFKYIQKNYTNWVGGNEERPILSHTLMREKVFPKIDSAKKPIFFVLIDNLRFDQWKIIQPLIEKSFYVRSEDLYYSILPTATQYARNSLFSGLMPSEIEKKYPQYWSGENDEGSKNRYEKELFEELLKRYGRHKKVSYHKVLNLDYGRRLADNMHQLLNSDFNIIVYNFVDMLSHARTEMDMIRELADDEAAYRSLTLSWFEHSPLYDMMQFIAEKGCEMIITTDHGSMRVDDPVKVIGDKMTNTNLRYKTGKSLNYNPKEVFAVRNPRDIFLPRTNVSSSYIFGKPGSFFAYPNNYNYYVKYYKNTFQHGGISLEEQMIPLITLQPKGV